MLYFLLHVCCMDPTLRRRISVLARLMSGSSCVRGTPRATIESSLIVHPSIYFPVQPLGNMGYAEWNWPLYLNMVIALGFSLVFHLLIVRHATRGGVLGSRRQTPALFSKRTKVPFFVVPPLFKEGVSLTGKKYSPKNFPGVSSLSLP